MENSLGSGDFDDDCSTISGSSDNSCCLEELSFDEIFDCNSFCNGTDSESYDSEDHSTCNRSSSVSSFSSYREKFEDMCLSQDTFEITAWDFSTLHEFSKE